MKSLMKIVAFLSVFVILADGCIGRNNVENIKKSANENIEATTESLKDSITRIFDSEKTDESASEFSTETYKNEMVISFVDVGQGDCTIIKCGDNTMMVDTGMYYEYDNVQEEMNNLGIRSLDYLVLTHPDADHIGSAEDVIEDYPVDTVLMPDCDSDSKTYSRLMTAIDESGVKIVHPTTEDIFAFGDATIDVLAPKYDVEGAYSDTNSFSIVCKVTYGINSVLLTGDATGEEIGDIIDYENVSADIIKLAHHGSANDGCNNYYFLDKVNPDYAIVSCGYNNDYGHPHRETMSYLKDNNIKMFRTDLQGTIRCVLDGKSITFDKENCKDFASGEELECE